MLRRLLTTLSVSLFLAGCASLQLPSPGSTATVLIVPADIKNSSAEEWSSKFKMLISRYDKDKWIAAGKMLPSSANPYFIITGLPAGQYKFHALGWSNRSMWRTSGGGSNAGETSFGPVYFNLTPATATLLDAEVVIKQTDNRGGARVHWDVKNLSEQRRTEVSRLLEQNNQANWPIVR